MNSELFNRLGTTARRIYCSPHRLLAFVRIGSRSLPRRPHRTMCMAVLVGTLLVTTSTYGVVFHIESDPGDGSVAYTPSTRVPGTGPTGESVRVGSAGPSPNRTNFNAIYTFELPDLKGSTLMDAELAFPFVDEVGSPSFDLDVWGVGYVSSPTLDGDWLYVGDNDTDPGINITNRQKLQDDVVATLADPGGTAVLAELDSTGRTNLVNFIQSLYTQGAQAGDFGIVRLNDDRANPNPNSGAPGGFLVGFREFGTLAPQLRLFDATVIDWNNGVSGDYYTAANWSPNNVPDNSPSAETVRFDVDATYNVHFDGGSTTSVNDLLIKQGNVTFLIPRRLGTSSATYRVNDQAILDGGTLIVANNEFGSDVDVNVANQLVIEESGKLQINGGTVSAGGNLLMSVGSTLTLDGGQLNANAGLDNSAGGTLDFRDGTLTVTGGAFHDVGEFGSYVIDGSTLPDLPHLVMGAGATADFLVDLDLFISVETSAQLTISGGASLSNRSSGLSTDKVSRTGLVNVDGDGSSWTNTDDLSVGILGTGILNVTDGGSVFNRNGIIGDHSSATGSVTVDGVGSTWNNTDSLSIGQRGSGTLNVTGGGAVFNQIGAIAEVSGSGMVTVDGEGSTWSNSGGLYVGGSDASAGGTGSLTVTGQGLVDVAGVLKIWNSGTVTLNGGTIALNSLDSFDIDVGGTFNFNFGTLNLKNDLTVNSGDLLQTVLGGAHTISSGKTLQVDGSTTLNNELTLSGGTFSTGEVVNPQLLQFKRGTLRLTGDGGLTVGAAGLFGPSLSIGGEHTIDVTNSVTIDSGATVSLAYGSDFLAGALVNNGQIFGTGNVLAPLTNNAGGEVQGLAGHYLVLSGRDNVSDGQITLSGGQVYFTGNLFIGETGLVIGNGTLRADGGLANAGTIALSSTSNVQGAVVNSPTGKIIASGGTTTFFDDVTNNGTIQVSQSSFAVFFGDYGGNGVDGKGTALMEGDLRPGNSPGAIDFGGNLVLGQSARTHIELSGVMPGEFDRLDIAGEATLDGELVVEILPGFEPSLGDRFEFIRVDGSRTGEFVGLPELSVVRTLPDFNLLISYEAGDGNDVALFTAIGDGAITELQAGDADQDFDFDQLDLVKVQIASKYLTGQPATWGEGDWDGAPGGQSGSPPVGNGFFDQLDIIAALGPGLYLTGPYAAIKEGGVAGDDQTSLVYDARTGGLSVDAPAGMELTSINVTSAGNRFVGDKPEALDGAFDNFAADNVFKATFGGSFGSISFGNVLPIGIAESDLAADLSVVGSLAGGGDLGDVDLVYVPEATSLLILVVGLATGLIHFRRLKG